MRLFASKTALRLLTVLFAGLIATGCANTRALKQADESANRGEWDEAVLKYAEVYQTDPTDLNYKMKYARARSEAAQIHNSRGEEHLRGGNYDAALLEFQAALVLEPSLGTATASMKKTKRLIDSIYYYGKAIEAMKKGDEKEAKAFFKKSLASNPENKLAVAELEKLKKPQRVVIGGRELDLKSTAPITLEFKDAGVKKVFDVLSKLSGINFIFDSEVKDERTSVSIKGATFQEALELILVVNRLSKKVVSENTIIVYPATQQKAAQYEEMMIKVFYLTNSDAKKAVNLVKTMLKARDIHVNEEINAIVVRARPDAIELAEKILEATDLADAEVMLDVSIMEINRNKASNLGINLSPDTITANVPATSGAITLGNLAKLSSADLLIGLPTAILNIKKEDLDANILANPKIRVKNKEKAKIHVGERVPIITTTVNQGISTENVQYQDVGLKLNVEPSVRRNDEVDIKLGLEVSSLGTKTTTNSGSVVYQIGTRNTETVLRLRDGETQIIGGLINDEERTTTARIPFVGEIPVVGRLFSNVDNSNVKTEILLSITPHIVRRLEVPEEYSSGFSSGREDVPTLRPLIEEFRPDVPLERGSVEAPPEAVRPSDSPPHLPPAAPHMIERPPSP